MERKPYVISAELDLRDVSANQIVKEGQIDSFRESLDRDLRNMGKETYWVSSGVMQRELGRLAATSPLPLISLDDRYLQSGYRIGLSRGSRYDENGLLVDAGYVSRVGYAGLDTQIDQVASRIGKKEVALADDVVFSGEMVERLALELLRRGISLKEVICGIGIGEGVERLTNLGIEVRAGQVFDTVEDELCERDFTLTRGSGRRLIPTSPSYPQGASLLYFDPRFGRPAQWASVPETNTQDFWRNSLVRNRDLLQSDVAMQTIGRVVGFSPDGTIGEAVSTALEEL